MCKSLHYQLRVISKVRTYLARDTLLAAIQAVFTSRLDFLNSLLVNAPDYHIRRLERLQNAAARVVSGNRKFDRITPTLKEFHWLPVQQRIKYKVCVLCYKSLNGSSPEYIADLLVVYHPDSRLRPSQQSLLLKPVKTRTRSYGERRFSFAAPTLWNALPSQSISEATKVCRHSRSTLRLKKKRVL